MRRLARAACFSAVLALHPSLASAAPEATAESYVEQGLELRRARRDEAALAAFERAYQTDSRPMILAQIGLAEQALGRFVEAEQHLMQSLATNDAWIDQHRATLERALSVIASRLSWLEISVNAPDAELRVDEQPRPRDSFPLRLPSGRHTLEVRFTGGVTIRRNVELGPGERRIYQLELPAPTRSPVVALPTPVPPRHPAPPAPMPAPPAPSNARSWAYASATLAGVALLEAVAASLVRQSYIDDYNSPECAPDRSQRCAAYRRSANTFGTIAVVGYAVAGAAGLTSFALFAEPWWSRSGAPPAGASLGVSGAF